MALVLRSQGEPSTPPVDDDTSLLSLVAELTLKDVDDVAASRKGKGRATAEISDEELAFQLFAEEANSLLDFTKDAAFARSINYAMQTDIATVEEFLREEITAREDRELAVALSGGRSRAPPSRAALRAPSQASVPSGSAQTSGLYSAR